MTNNQNNSGKYLVISALIGLIGTLSTILLPPFLANEKTPTQIPDYPDPDQDKEVYDISSGGSVELSKPVMKEADKKYESEIPNSKPIDDQINASTTQSSTTSTKKNEDKKPIIQAQSNTTKSTSTPQSISQSKNVNTNTSLIIKSTVEENRIIIIDNTTGKRNKEVESYLSFLVNDQAIVKGDCSILTGDSKTVMGERSAEIKLRLKVDGKNIRLGSLTGRGGTDSLAMSDALDRGIDMIEKRINNEH